MLVAGQIIGIISGPFIGAKIEQAYINQ